MITIPVQLPSPLQKLEDERLKKAGITLYLKRDDLIHPDLPGNKWRKLVYNLQQAKVEGHKTLLTFGGAYSNHLRAVAAAGKLFDFATIGIVRGEEHLPLNWSLTYAQNQEMELHYIDRQTYRNKQDTSFITSLHKQYGKFYLLPEGGSNALAVKGCGEIATEITVPFQTICCSVGTGGTLAGVASSLKPGQQAIGFSALKGGDFLSQDVTALQRQAFSKATNNWHIETAYHFGGFAKSDMKLKNFIKDFASRHGILLEQIYVAKMIYGIFDLIEKGVFHPHSTIIAVVTGSPEPMQ